MLFKLKKLTYRYFLFFTFLVAFSLPFGIYISKLVIFLWGIIWLFELFFNKFKLNYRLGKTQKFIFVLIFLYLFFHVIGLFYSENIKIGLRNINIKIYLIVIPLFVLSNKQLLERYYKSILNFFVLGNLTASLFLIIRAFANSITISNGKIFFQSALREEYGFLESITHYGNNFFYSVFSYFLHPSYASLLIIISIVILIYQSKINGRSFNLWDKILSKRKVYIPLILFLSFVILLMSSKTNFIVLFVVLFAVIISSKIKFRFLILFLIFIISVFFISRNQRFNMYLKYIAKYSIDNVPLKSGTSRYHIWKTGFKLADENFWFGVGTGDLIFELSEYYKKKNLKTYNLHNEFYETLIRLGVFPFLILFYLFIYGFWVAYKGRNYVLIYFFVITAINFFFESMLDRVAGTIFFGFFLSLTLLKQKEEKIYFNAQNNVFNRNKNAIFFFLIFFLYLFVYHRGLNFHFYSSDISNGWFKYQNISLNDFLNFNEIIRALWGQIFYVPNLYWHRILDAFLVAFSFTLLYRLLSIIIYKNNLLSKLFVFVFAILFSFTNLPYFNFLIVLMLLLSAFYFIIFIIFKKRKFFLKKSKKYLILAVIFFLIFIKLLFEYDFNRKNILTINKFSSSYLFHKLEKSNQVNLIGIRDKKQIINNTDSLFNYVKELELTEQKYATNIQILPYLLNNNAIILKSNIKNYDINPNFYILSTDYSEKNNLKGYKLIFENNNYKVFEKLKRK